MLDRLVCLLYDDLLRMAHRQLRRHRPTQTLTTVALVHEAYVRLCRHAGPESDDVRRFLALAARAMRHTIVDCARRRNARKRGGAMTRCSLVVAEPAVVPLEEAVLALNDALGRMAEQEPRLARVVECRYFGGLTEDETAEVLGVSTRTVQRDWSRARDWLRSEVGLDAAAR
jgi:RNA polymerase sigma factor (TIGR02999 family)